MSTYICQLSDTKIPIESIFYLLILETKVFGVWRPLSHPQILKNSSAININFGQTTTASFK
jgi:hypothetical protein